MSTEGIPTQANTEVNDRRASLRRPCSIVVSLDEDSQSTSSLGRVENISENGLGMILSRRIDLGTNLKATLWRSDEAYLGTINVRVVRVTDRGRNEWLHGCQSIS